MMKKYGLLLLILWSCTTKAQLRLSSTSTPSLCSSDGSITILATGGTLPYLYQIISSTTGVIRPAQNIDTFQNLAPGNYTIRVTDGNNLTAQIIATVNGNYVPPRFTVSQTQSTVTVTPLNGKPPFQYTYAPDGTNTFLPYTSNNVFPCMSAGAYAFRIKDSCDNIYTETILVNPVPIRAIFNCNTDNGIRTISLQSINGGNGGFMYTLIGNGFTQTNTTGNFTVTNKCLSTLKIVVTDKCNMSTEVTVCPKIPFHFNLACVNFGDRTLTIDSVIGGSGIPFQYIANETISNTSTVSGFIVTADSIVFGIIDSCGTRTVLEIKKMTLEQFNESDCFKGSIEVKANYTFNEHPFNFYPVRYYSLDGPTAFSLTANSDTDNIVIQNLSSGVYTLVVENACGDTIMHKFEIANRCYKSMIVRKKQSCTSTTMIVVKDCTLDTNVLFKLYNMHNVLLASNYTGIFNTDNDSCYKVVMQDTLCDTTFIDYINPLNINTRYVEDGCNKIVIGVQIGLAKDCGEGNPYSVNGTLQFLLLDSLYNILLTTQSNVFSTIPPGTKYIITKLDQCLSDTLMYSASIGFIDTVRMCIRPTAKVVNNKCRFAWQIELLNNPINHFYTLTGNNTNITSSHYFLGVDSGQYILSDGCNRQPIFLPNLYNYSLDAIGSCPGNSVIKAGFTIDSAYISQTSIANFYTICQSVIMDYTIQEVGNPLSAQYNPTGLFTNLKNGTYYAVFYKGNAQCNYFSDTIFTPFYTRPSLSATYGLICNGSNATVKVSVDNGRPPYTFEVVNSSVAPITTDSTFVFYNTLPLGTSQFKVIDACGVSIDYATEVLSVDFVPTHKKQCDGRIELIAPDIFNTTYTWTDRDGDTIGTQPSVFTAPNGNDTFYLNIRHYNCDLNKTIIVDDFSISVVSANAGPDKIVDTSFAILDGNNIPPNAEGTWTQINPSSGISTFDNMHQYNSGVHVDVFPGRYTYVWTVTDTIIGCIVRDTVEISFLKCPGITDIIYNKSKTNGICGPIGNIEINIVQSSLPVKYLWNTGDTSRVISGLDSGMYIVKIFDNSACTQDIYDTTYISTTAASSGIVKTSICNGDTFILNQNNYWLAGIYYDTLTNSVGCDSLLKIELSLKDAYYKYDTIRICNGESSTLPNGQSINLAGNYPVNYQTSLGCDSNFIYTLEITQKSQKSIDSTLCYNSIFVLKNGNSVSQSGTYFDTLLNAVGCDSILQYNLSFLPKLNKPSLGLDTIICWDDELQIEVLYPSYVRYLWQDQFTQASYTINQKGTFWLQVSDGCTIEKDTITVDTKICDCHFYIPDAFSPNNDGFNDFFAPLPKCEFYKDYTFDIYNRWGELLFSSNHHDIKWDGKYKKTGQPLDDYIWILRYTEIRTGEKIEKKGILTLLR